MISVRIKRPPRNRKIPPPRSNRTRGRRYCCARYVTPSPDTNKCTYVLWTLVPRGLLQQIQRVPPPFDLGASAFLHLWALNSALIFRIASSASFAGAATNSLPQMVHNCRDRRSLTHDVGSQIAVLIFHRFEFLKLGRLARVMCVTHSHCARWWGVGVKS